MVGGVVRGGDTTPARLHRQRGQFESRKQLQTHLLRLQINKKLCVSQRHLLLVAGGGERSIDLQRHRSRLQFPRVGPEHLCIGKLDCINISILTRTQIMAELVGGGRGGVALRCLRTEPYPI